MVDITPRMNCKGGLGNGPDRFWAGHSFFQGFPSSLF